MKRTYPAPLSIFLFLLFASDLHGQEPLRKEIENLIHTVNASVGVGIRHLESGDTLTIHGNDQFPMQSVYKVHVALAVLTDVDRGKLSVDQKIFIRKEDLMPKTHSPIRQKYPNGNVELTIKELLFYTVAQSDNNGCDILIRLVEGPKNVEKVILNMGIKDVAVVYTEQEMSKAWDRQFKNWTTPRAMTELLVLLYQQKILSSASTGLLVEIMKQTSTGPKRLRGLLPSGTVVAHKTGTGGPSDTGVLGAVNDVGIVTLPNGKHIAIALFISHAEEAVNKLEMVTAQISKLVYDHYASAK